MPRSAWRAACSIALAATIGLTSVTAGWAQTQYQQQPTQQQPNQQTQPYQQQQFLPQQPNDTVTRDVLGVFGTTPNQGQGSTVARPGTATQAEGGPTVAPAIGDTERRTAREELQPFGASLFAGTSPARDQGLGRLRCRRHLVGRPRRQHIPTGRRPDPGRRRRRVRPAGTNRKRGQPRVHPAGLRLRGAGHHAPRRRLRHRLRPQAWALHRRRLRFRARLSGARRRRRSVARQLSRHRRGP